MISKKAIGIFFLCFNIVFLTPIYADKNIFSSCKEVTPILMNIIDKNKKSDKLEKQNIEKAFNTILSEISPESTNFEDFSAAMSTKCSFRNVNLRDFLKKFFINYYDIAFNNNKNPLFEEKKNQKTLVEEVLEELTVHTPETIYNKVIASIYGAAFYYGRLRKNAIKKSYIILLALETLKEREIKKNIDETDSLLKIFFDGIFTDSPVSAIKKLARMSYDEYTKSFQSIDTPYVTDILDGIGCFKEYKEELEDEFKEKSDEVLENIPNILYKDILEKAFLMHLKSASITKITRKKIIDALNKKEYRPKENITWKENTTLIEKIIKALSDERSSEKTKYKANERLKPNMTVHGRLSFGGGAERGKTEIRGAGLIGFGVDPFFRSAEDNQDKKPKKLARTSTFFKRKKKLRPLQPSF